MLTPVPILMLWVWLAITMASLLGLGGDVAEDYQQLVEYSNIAAVAYCVQHGLAPGRMGDYSTKCPLEACQDDRLRNIELLHVFDFSGRSDVGSGYFAIDHKRKEILLVFRGTSSRRDWATDLDFIPVGYTPLAQEEEFSLLPIITTTCEGCNTHRGFYKLMREKCLDLIESVISLADEFPTYKIVVVGHSLGAALTVLCGVELQILGFDPLVISYASPRVGNRAFVDYVNTVFDSALVARDIEEHGRFDRGLIRVTHMTDIIPHLPPKPLFDTGMGYEYYIAKEELPHYPEDIQRRGIDRSRGYDSDRENDQVSAYFLGNPTALWPSFLGKYAHANYFREISSCE